MPIFTPSISQQNTAGSSGVSGYPQIGSIKQFTIISDEFNREVLNPANMPALYSTGGVGTPTFTMASNNSLNVASSAAINDNADCRISLIGVKRVANYIDTRSQITFDVIFQPQNNLNEKFFIGLVDSTAVLTGLPGTTRSLGIYQDTSVTANAFLTSANGTTQVTTDTGIALTNNSKYRLTIIWSGDDSATITLYSPSGSGGSPLYTTSVKSQTVTSLANAAEFFSGYEIHLFVQTLTTQTRGIYFIEWRLSAV